MATDTPPCVSTTMGVCAIRTWSATPVCRHVWIRFWPRETDELDHCAPTCVPIRIIEQLVDRASFARRLEPADNRTPALLSGQSFAIEFGQRLLRSIAEPNAFDFADFSELFTTQNGS